MINSRYIIWFVAVFLMFFSFTITIEANTLSEEQYIQEIDNLESLLIEKGGNRILEEWHKKAQDGNKLYPESSGIAYRLAYIRTMFSLYPEAFRAMLPFVHLSPKNPEATFYMWRTFNSMRNSMLWNDPTTPRDSWTEMFGEEDPNITFNMLSMATSYYAHQIDENWLFSEKTKKNIAEQRKTLPKADTKEMIRIWSKAINSFFKQELKNTRYQASNKIKEELYWARVNSNQKDRNETLQKGLEELNTFLVPPNDLQKIEKSLYQLRGANLEKYQDIPNYDDLKKAFPNTSEADILNAAFKIYSKGQFAEGLSCIEEIRDSKDMRLFYMKVTCLLSLERTGDEILEVLNAILEVEPDNADIYILRESIIAEKEFDEKQNKKRGGL